MKSYISNQRRICLVVLFFFCTILACNCVDAAIVPDGIIINDRSFSVINGDTWNFNQGYNLTVKSVNVETARVWIELSLGNKVLISDIYKQGDIFTYNKNNQPIFKIYLNKIYEGELQGKELVYFSPVYQYLDPELSKPIIYENKTNDNHTNSPIKPTVDNNFTYGDNFIKLTFFVIIAIITLILIIKKK